MKADVVVCFYKGFVLWPYVAWGLKQNQDHIGRVIVSNDEAWNGGDKEVIRIGAESVDLTAPIIYVGHPRNGMRQTQCFNDGVKEVISDYVLQIDDDIVLAPNCVATFLKTAEKGTLLTGRLHDIPRGDFPISLLAEPPIMRLDKRVVSPQIARDLWVAVRDSFLFYHKDDYHAIGGHDETYQDGQEKGYGFVDYDFGLRWFMHFGPDSFEMTPAIGYHMSGLKPGFPFSLINKAKFDAKLEEYHAWLGEN